MKFITYNSGSEVLVTVPDQEQEFLIVFFGDGIGRNLEDYDREEFDECGVKVDFSAQVD